MMASSSGTAPLYPAALISCIVFILNFLTIIQNDEKFIGWGKEDSDIAIRLINAGIRKKFIKMGGICYHLYHKEASRELELKNTELMNDGIMSRTTWAQKGIDQYL